MRIPVLLFCCWLATGCTNPGHIPSDVIGKDSMAQILWDLVQADQFSTNYLVKDSARMNVKTETMKLYDEVFALHHISRKDFDKSFQFYLDHPDITTVMFDSISARANRMRTEVYRTRPVKTPISPPVK
ncbi:MAG TPA: DUF4296 domain-containing protein [Puia sp.]|nr:DUF4296 domain-containing protein [Puia sp.]